MWVQEIVKSLDMMSTRAIRVSPEFANAVDTYINVVNKSHAFYLGDIFTNDLISVNQFSDKFILPYDDVLLLFTMDKYKRGIIVNQDDDDFYINPIVCDNERWCPSSRNYVCSRAITDGTFKYAHYDIYEHRDRSDDAERLFASSQIKIVTSFCTLLTCKNITAEEKYPDLDCNRKLARKGQQPKYSYHILKIKPLSIKPKTISTVGESIFLIKTFLPEDAAQRLCRKWMPGPEKGEFSHVREWLLSKDKAVAPVEAEMALA